MILPNKGKDGDSTFEETLLSKLSLYSITSVH